VDLGIDINIPAERLNEQGPLGCLRALLDAQGRPVEWGVLPAIAYRLLGDRSTEPAGLLELQRVAQSLGHEAEAYRVGFDELDECDVPCIAMLEGGDLVALLHLSKCGYVVFDPARGVGPMDEDELAERWGGIIFCVSESNVPVTAQPALESEPGRLRQQQVLRRFDLRPLAQTRLSNVYRGSMDAQPVCIKLVPFHFPADSRQVMAFHQELEIVARLNGDVHPNVLDIRHSDRDGRWLAAEFIDGVGLDELAMPLSGRRIQIILRQVIDALEFLHRRRIVHRDVSARNVLVTQQDRAVLIDFGLAFIDDGTAPAAPRSGTPWFKSPEQYAGTGIGPATDMFAVGLLALYLATGEHPLADQIVEPYLQTPYTTAGFAQLTSCIAELPPTLREFVARCCAPRAEERCSHAIARRLLANELRGS